MDDELELRFLRFLVGLNQSLRQMRHPLRMLSLAVRATQDFFNADAVCVIERVAGGSSCRSVFRLPRASSWPEDTLKVCLGRTTISQVGDSVLAPVFRRGKPDSALVVRRSKPLPKSEQRLLRQVASALSRALDTSEKERLAKVRSRIDQKLMDDLRPNDLFYHILHGLRSLTRYDHSSSLMVFDDERDGLRVRAEQISYRKAKSQHIGALVSIPEPLHSELLRHSVMGFDRTPEGWVTWGTGDPGTVAEWLDEALAWEEPAGALICAPLSIKGRLMGLLRIAARHPGMFGSYEAELVRRFLPLTSVAIRRAQRTESLRATVLESERKSAISDLARSVAHDVNNALGSTIPLLQQSLRDLSNSEFSVEDLREDMRQSLESVQFCRRIFGGMLAFAKSKHHRSREGQLRRAVDRTLAVLQNSLDRRGVCVDVTLSHRNDHVPCPQADLEQLMFNLIANARDAMPEGGHLRIESRESRGGITMVIEDDGVGISPEVLPHVQEPFYSTKLDGHGLGLAICRSIVWEMRGKMRLKSEPASGTRVELWLPKMSETGKSDSCDGAKA